MKTSELTGTALDWAVHVALHGGCEGYPEHEYSADWAIGGPIIEREKIAIGFDPKEGWIGMDMDGNYFMGATPLEAAMRCYAISKMGNEIEIPEELL